MDVNLSLDDIIKKKKTKMPGKNGKKDGKKRSRPRKTTKDAKKKPAIRKVQKSNATTFKRNSRRKAGAPVIADARLKLSKMPDARLKLSRMPDARLKLSKVPDARLKILRNKNQPLKNHSPSAVGKGVLIDARMKIEAHKQRKQKKVEDRSRPFGITTIGGDGIIERRINASIVNNAIHMEYEDEDMNLESETLAKENWSGKPFLVRRTIQNNTGWRSNGPLSDDNRYRDTYETRSFKDFTRTIANSSYEKPPVNFGISRRPHSRRSPPVQSDSFSNNYKMRSSRLSPPPRSSSLLRDSHHHLIVISNLHENVTGEDIKELFEDVGDLVYAKMIKEGVAEVAYRSQRDAMKAVEIYHNRQLDGLPMKCVMVSAHRDSSSSSSSRNVPPISTFTPVEPDTHLIKKALFSSSR